MSERGDEGRMFLMLASSTSLSPAFLAASSLLRNLWMSTVSLITSSMDTLRFFVVCGCGGRRTAQVGQHRASRRAHRTFVSLVTKCPRRERTSARSFSTHSSSSMGGGPFMVQRPDGETCYGALVPASHESTPHSVSVLYRSSRRVREL
jgi:hypothetical protein